MPEHPRARENDLLTQSLGDELLVFDSAANRAHSLNATAAAVWRASDGTRSPSQIAEHCQLDPLAVDLALSDLADARLLADHTPPAQRVSRRSALRRMALTGATLGVALPVIRSIVAPSPAMAGSTAGTSCATPADCTGAGSFCHSDRLCHHSTCISSTGSHSGTCVGNPCCVGNVCMSSNGFHVCG
jgi:hypothetical protein